MSQYGFTLDQAWSFPLEAYLALLPAMISRHGGKHHGPDHADSASIAARERCKRFLRRHFTILPPHAPAPPHALHRWLSTQTPKP